MDLELNGLIVHDKPISELTLKKVLLIFDKVFFIAPSENEFLIPDKVASYKIHQHVLHLSSYHNIYNGEFYHEDEDSLLDQFDYAINKGIIRILDLRLRKFYEKNWLPLRLSFDWDTSNPNILNCLIPRILKEESFSIKDGVMRGGFVSPAGIKIYPDIPNAVSFFSEEENRKFLCDHQLYSSIGKINRSLAVCSEFSLIPIFVNQNIASAFSEKFEIEKTKKEENLLSKFKAFNNIEMYNIQYLLFQLADTIIDEKVLNSISVRELIITRNNTVNELYKLRRKLIQNLKFLATRSYNDDFLHEVETYIKLEIIPQVRQYRNSFLAKFSTLLGYSAAGASATLGTYLGIHQGLTPMQIAYLSGISATVGNITNDLANYIGNKNNKEFKNTFSYFLKFDN